MRNLLNHRQNRLILAALAVGSLTLSAAGFAQSRSATKKTSHPTSSGTSSSTPGTARKGSKTRKGATRKSKRVKGQVVPTPERINDIQAALTQRGFYTGEPTSKWDDATSASMMKFQAANGLNPTGKLDALTLQKLGFGSETAGLGAPAVPPNTPNRLLSSKVQREEQKNETEPE